MANISEAPYGSWKSPITSDLIIAGSLRLGDVLLDGDVIHWIEGRPQEGGRHVLVRWTADGRNEDVTPAPYNARTSAHEYGGGAVTVADGTVYFSNFTDQRLCRLPPGGAAQPMTPEGRYRYADGLIDTRRSRWIGIREEHSDTNGGGEPVNSLVAIDLTSGGPGELLAGGNDFYASPRLSPDGTRLAWLTWNHPNMPWVGTELWVARIGSGGRLETPVKVAGGADESIVQPEWSPDGRLYFISDRSGWWNLYRADAGGATPLCPRAAEFAQAQWNFGMSSYAFAAAETLVCSYQDRGLGRLARLDLAAGGQLTPIDLPYTEFASVRASGDRVVFRAGSAVLPESIVLLTLSSGETEVLQTATQAADGDLRKHFCRPTPVEFPTAGGTTAHALFYPPHNPDYRAPAGERPPLLVKCHGGPTAAASSTLSLGIQFWTSRGIGVLDVNYGGSTGYGRAYRNRLHRCWGVVDVEDCVNGARWLADQGRADPARLVITGGSAGGFTVLAALAFHDVFKGGASHYGVSDLEALARDTHKFESRYLDWLIGPHPEQQDTYRERSPVHHADRIRVPVAFFQGEEDEIVPPNQTERMVAALRRNGIPVGYLLFSGEQHGFRRGPNIQRALDAELYFYSVLVFKAGLTF
jgi:dipeptidyl aminopeptidase/acylaminoacyl peptidase